MTIDLTTARIAKNAACQEVNDAMEAHGRYNPLPTLNSSPKSVHNKREGRGARGWLKHGKLAFKAHPHMLRHACGYALANKGHDTRALQAYLGHRNIQHTVRYTELSPTRFKEFWRE